MGNKFTLQTLKEHYPTYEERMLAAWVGKPEKVPFYKIAFQKFAISGNDRFGVVWSWWAFLGGFWFFLYRKAYLEALTVFLISFFAVFIPFIGPILVMIGVGLSAIYFLYKRYLTIKMEIEALVEEEDKRLEFMLIKGGYNSWVVWVTAIIGISVLLINLFLLAIIVTN